MTEPVKNPYYTPKPGVSAPVRHAASLMGRRGKDIPKNINAEDRRARSERQTKVWLDYNAKLKAGLVTRRARKAKVQGETTSGGKPA